MASVDEVNALFNSFIFARTGTNPLGPGPSNYSSGLDNDGWGDDFLNVFQPTWGPAIDPDAIPEIRGWVYTPSSTFPSAGMIGRVDSFFTLGHILNAERASTGDFWDTGDFVDDSTGAWLFRPSISEVPLPATAWLFGSALLGLFGVARRKEA